MSERSAFATVTDITTLWRPLTASETTRAEALLLLVSDEIRVIATSVGKDVDLMIQESEPYPKLQAESCEEGESEEHSQRAQHWAKSFRCITCSSPSSSTGEVKFPFHRCEN